MDNAFAYVMQHGLCTEEDYAYEAIDEPCRNSTVKEKARLHVSSELKSEWWHDWWQPHDVTGFVDVHSKDGEAMKEALQSGPVSVAIEADMPDFQFYHEGVLTGRNRHVTFTRSIQPRCRKQILKVYSPRIEP